MKRFTQRSLIAGLCVVCLIAQTGWAQKLTLKDGTVLEGTVISRGNSYWVKTADGQSREVPAGDVVSVNGVAVGSSSPVEMPSSDSLPFRSAKHRADAVESPLAAVAIWQQFIDNNPNSSELPAARHEQASWKDLADRGAEKIKGVWVAGDDLKDLKDRSAQMWAEAMELLNHQQTLKSIERLQEADRIYPNSFRVNFWLGFVSMLQRKYDDAATYFDAAVRLRPASPEALCNYGVALAMQSQFEKAIISFQKAVEIEDSQEVVQNLVNALAQVPYGMKVNNPRIKAAAESAQLLAGRYGITGPDGKFKVVSLKPSRKGEQADEGNGAMWSGTGFVISDDGLILTNKHVVDGSKTLMVVFDQGKQSSAEVVAVDDEQDLALIRVKSKSKTPFVKLSKADEPGDGAECTVMGFPLLDRLGAAVKVTRGIVSSATHTHSGADVIVDAKVNPGNSGGPILDKNGNVMAIVCMKSLASTTEDSYGIGISAGHIRRFLFRNKIAVTPGEAEPTSLSAEDIAAKTKPATVCILATK